MKNRIQPTETKIIENIYMLWNACTSTNMQTILCKAAGRMKSSEKMKLTHKHTHSDNNMKKRCDINIQINKIPRIKWEHNFFLLYDKLCTH